MRRTVYKQLLEWKNSSHRKPLIVYGARQVGKTYILKAFGENEFDDMVYINCYKNEAVESVFGITIDVEKILIGLSAITGTDIIPGRTFLFLDEVQEIPSVVASLKYFCEQMPQLHIAVAGSLLGVMNMEKNSFPTGKVEILHMYPMTFIEFLKGIGEYKKAELLCDSSMYEVINGLLPEYNALLREYYYVGGMPEAVKEYAGSKNLGQVRKIQNDILTAYIADIAKHAGNDVQRARAIFESIPSQLAKENKKFTFSVLKKGARMAEYENAIQWLVDAGLIYKINRITKIEIPITFFMEKGYFKLFLLDVGLLCALSQIPAELILVGDSIFSNFKGAFTENYVLTQIKTLNDMVVGYFSKDNSSAELDFVVQQGAHIYPIEVKAEENVRAKSLRQIISIDNAGRDITGYRFSMKGFVNQGWMENVPLAAIIPFMEKHDSPTI